MVTSLVSKALVAVLLAATAGCTSNSFTRREIYDSRTPAQQIAGGEAAAQNVGDLADLYRRDVDRGIALLDRVPDKGSTRADWGAHWLILTGAADHATELRERLSLRRPVHAQEINAITEHGRAQAALNRTWVLRADSTANADAVLASLGAPKPWTSEALTTRMSGGNLRGALENERVHLYNYAGLLGLMVGKATEQGLAGTDYWALEAQQIAGVHAIVEADVVALREGATLDPRRITASWDMANASRTLMGYRLPEAFGPVLYAMRNLSVEQARQLQGNNFMDKDALARFRGFWTETRKMQQAGWLDAQVDQAPEMLTTVWWCFRAIPPQMFTGKGELTLPAPVAVETDAQALAKMQEISQPQRFVPAAPPAAEQPSTATAAK